MRIPLIAAVLCLGLAPVEELALKPGHLLEGHSKRVLSVAFSRDGKQVATGGEDGTARIWSVESGEEETNLNTHWAVTGLAFSKDGKQLITSSWGAQVWEVESGNQLRHLEGHTGFTTCMGYSPDGRTLATGGVDGTVRLSDTTTWQEKAVLQHCEQVTCITISPDGNRLVSAGDTMLKLWDMTGKELQKTPFAGAQSVGYLADSKRIAVSCGDKGFCLLEPSAGAKPQMLEIVGGPMALSPDGKMLAVVVHEKSIQIWDIEHSRRLVESDSQKSPITCLAFSPNGKLLATGSADSTAQIWSVGAR